jgi:DNA repair and recombination RAD54-like protein
MGLGKTLMSITIMWTLLNQGFVRGESAVRKVIIVCPTSLVGNWDNEIRKWVGEDKCHTFAVKSDPQKIIKQFLQFRGKGVLIVSYETQRRYSTLFVKKKPPPPSHLIPPLASSIADISSNTVSNASGVDQPAFLNVTSGSNNICDLLICDEAHKLKNAESGLAKSLDVLPARKRILLSGTPMQNDLIEFFNMVSFCNPNILGSVNEFRRKYVCVYCDIGSQSHLFLYFVFLHHIGTKDQFWRLESPTRLLT